MKKSNPFGLLFLVLLILLIAMFAVWTTGRIGIMFMPAFGADGKFKLVVVFVLFGKLFCINFS